MSLNGKMKWDVRAIVEDVVRAALDPILARLNALEGKPTAEQAAAFADGAGVDLSDDAACPTGESDPVEPETEPDAEPVPPKRARKAAK